MSEHEIPVSLTVREIRSLTFAASSAQCAPLDDSVREHGGASAAESGAMKLEVALVQAGEPCSGGAR